MRYVKVTVVSDDDELLEEFRVPVSDRTIGQTAAALKDHIERKFEVTEEEG